MYHAQSIFGWVTIAFGRLYDAVLGWVTMPFSASCKAFLLPYKEKPPHFK